jgi:hypothetical protein
VTSTEDPLAVKRSLDTFNALVITNLQIAWLIFGNTFHYSTDGYACKSLSPETKQLWILMQIILAYGYIIFAS